jgi:hypothetical protein
MVNLSVLHVELVIDVHWLVVLLYLQLFLDNRLDGQLIKLLFVLLHMHVELIQQHVYVQQIEDHNQISMYLKKGSIEKKSRKFLLLMIAHA